MNRTRRLKKQELRQLAQKATELSYWLQTKTVLAASQTPIPKELVTVSTVVVVTGSIILMDSSLIPDSVCWSGCNCDCDIT